METLTAEDLFDIYEWGKAYVVDRPTIAQLHHEELLGRIESMINNYCDHFYLSPHGNAVRCQNCGKGITESQVGDLSK